jgi:metal-responsive CopG/Arc/MetJ family transcriptional regulator
MVYELKNDNADSFLNSEGENEGKESKESQNCYLLSRMFQTIDRRAEERGNSRNQVLRDILRDEFQEVNFGEKGEMR